MRGRGLAIAGGASLAFAAASACVWCRCSTGCIEIGRLGVELWADSRGGLFEFGWTRWDPADWANNPWVTRPWGQNAVRLTPPGWSWARPRLDGNSGVSSVVLPMYALPLALVSLALARSRMRRDERTAGVCAGCGYDVRGLAAGVCPECGGPAPVPGGSPGPPRL